MNETARASDGHLSPLQRMAGAFRYFLTSSNVGRGSQAVDSSWVRRPRYRDAVNQRDRAAAERVRAQLDAGARDARAFRASIEAVPPLDRDAWLDVALGLGPPPADGPELPPGGVPYLPCAIDSLLRSVDVAAIAPTDVVVDIGSGAGRAAVTLHLLTGAVRRRRRGATRPRRRRARPRRAPRPRPRHIRRG